MSFDGPGFAYYCFNGKTLSVLNGGSAQDYWKQNITYLKGVGPKRAAVLGSECGVFIYEDLLHYYPRKHIDRSRLTPIAHLNQDGQMAVVLGRLGRFEIVEGERMQQLRVSLSDGQVYLQLSWFKGARYVAQKFREGEAVVVFGRVTMFRDRPQMAHPEIESLVQDQDAVHALNLTPLYPSTEALKRQGLDSRGLRALTWRVLHEGQDQIADILPHWLADRFKLPALGWALRQIHFPDSWQDLQRAERRLKFDEFLLFELIMVRRRHLMEARSQSQPFAHLGAYFNQFFHEHLPFELTNAQKRVVREIRHDVGRNRQMNRLVQGDVGSGKTIVAVLAMLMAIDNGYQAALMAPTEILAEQHFRTIYHLLAPLKINICLLTGGQKARLKKSVLASLANGQTHIAIGTHALIQEAVQFQNLGLTVIDEQHKFGVLQRAQLWSKARRPPHNIAMSATPIPRTLAMSVYGDIDVSVIDELPPGRKPIQTVVRHESQRLAVFGFLREQMQQGRQVYVVYPLVEESSKLDLLAATAGFEALERAFQDFRVTMVHGRMDSEAKDYEMQRFKRGEVQLLVSTTVIEVGVDVPNATVMVIENAERFGLSQLHQLRGRVGRGGEQSYCILMAGGKVTDVAKERLKAMVETQDGFRIAEIDLKLRGPGDFLGTRQSGLPEFKLADVVADGDVLEEARAAAFLVIGADPDLAAPEHEGLKRHLLRFATQHKLQDLIA